MNDDYLTLAGPHTDCMSEGRVLIHSRSTDMLSKLKMVHKCLKACVIDSTLLKEFKHSVCSTHCTHYFDIKRYALCITSEEDNLKCMVENYFIS